MRKNENSNFRKKNKKELEKELEKKNKAEIKKRKLCSIPLNKD